MTSLRSLLTRTKQYLEQGWTKEALAVNAAGAKCAFYADEAVAWDLSGALALASIGCDMRDLDRWYQHIYYACTQYSGQHTLSDFEQTCTDVKDVLVFIDFILEVYMVAKRLG